MDYSGACADFWLSITYYGGPIEQKETPTKEISVPKLHEIYEQKCIKPLFLEEDLEN